MRINGQKELIDIMKKKHPKDNKFHKGNGQDGKHYWLTPDNLMKELK